jgi:hypothetical protein
LKEDRRHDAEALQAAVLNPVNTALEEMRDSCVIAFFDAQPT